MLTTSLLYNAPHLPVAIVAIALGLVQLRKLNRHNYSDLEWSLFLTAIIGFAVAAVLRPKAYTYLGAAQMLLTPCLAWLILRYIPDASANETPVATTRRPVFAILILLLCVSTANKNLCQSGFILTTLPSTERPDYTFAHLRAQIPAAALVGAMSPHWHAFQGRNPWREAFFVSIGSIEELQKCDWLVLPPGVGEPPGIEAFEKVEQVYSDHRDSHTYAYSLWKRAES